MQCGCPPTLLHTLPLSLNSTASSKSSAVIGFDADIGGRLMGLEEFTTSMANQQPNHDRNLAASYPSLLCVDQ